MTILGRLAPIVRYHPLLTGLHWLLAILIVVQLAGGFFALARMTNTDPEKIGALRFHMIAGDTILALMAVRFVVRLATKKPPPATTGSRALDGVAAATHYGFYLLVLLLGTSGIVTALVAGLNRIVFQGSGEALPSTFSVFPSFVGHAVLAIVLAAIIALHVAGAMFHQFGRRDHLMRRMWFGRRNAI